MRKILNSKSVPAYRTCVSHCPQMPNICLVGGCSTWAEPEVRKWCWNSGLPGCHASPSTNGTEDPRIMASSLLLSGLHTSFLFIYLLLFALGLRCCTRTFSSCGEWGLLFLAVRGLLIAVASLVAEHGLYVRGFQ